MTSLFLGMIFGSIGLGYIVYGRQQRRGIAFLSGVALCVVPYFVSSLLFMVMIAIALMVLPYYLRF